MRLKLNLVVLSAVYFLILYVTAFSQDDMFSKVSSNQPLKGEELPSTTFNKNESELHELDNLYKEALENGNYSKAESLKQEMYRLIPKENLIEARELVSEHVRTSEQHLPNTDWVTNNNYIHYGNCNSISGFFKQTDLKFGEDNFLYSVTSNNSGGFNYFEIYKSSNMGLNWTKINFTGFLRNVSNISITIESRNNLNPDSTRVQIFCTSSIYNDYASSALNLVSVRADGNSTKYYSIADPDAGNKITHISAVSDGAYWQFATYLGVVCTEADNTTGVTKKVRFFRTIDWGATWMSSSLSTAFNDKHPSAGFRKGTPDSIYIALERNFDQSNKQLRVIATSWLPSSNYNVYFLTSEANVKYEKPCITILQNNPAASAMITSTKDNNAFYHFTSNGGRVWNIDYLLNSGSMSGKLYTYCASNVNGNTNFTTSVLTMNKDSINIRKGNLGNMGNTVFKVNNVKLKSGVMPVCDLTYMNGRSQTAVSYAGTTEPHGNVYMAQEGLKKLRVKAFPQGMYNSVTNQLSAKDTMKIILRRSIAPFDVVEYVAAVFDTIFFHSYYTFSNLNDDSYYCVLRHRNSLETWSKNPIDFTTVGDKEFDFTQNIGSAFGDNLILVDNEPVRYGVYGGDVNRTGSIDLQDVVTIYNHAYSFASGYIISDLTGDSMTDLTDILIAFNNSTNFVSLKRP